MRFEHVAEKKQLPILVVRVMNVHPPRRQQGPGHGSVRDLFTEVWYGHPYYRNTLLAEEIPLCCPTSHTHCVGAQHGSNLETSLTGCSLLNVIQYLSRPEDTKVVWCMSPPQKLDDVLVSHNQGWFWAYTFTKLLVGRGQT